MHLFLIFSPGTIARSAISSGTKLNDNLSDSSNATKISTVGYCWRSKGNLLQRLLTFALLLYCTENVLQLKFIMSRVKRFSLKSNVYGVTYRHADVLPT